MPGIELPHGYPKHWEQLPTDANPYTTRVEALDRSSIEYKMVVEKFYTSVEFGGALYKLDAAPEDVCYIKQDIMDNPGKVRVVDVVAVRNFSQEHSYQGVLRGIMAEQKMSEENAQETVYHGTDKDAALSIAHKGFNRNKTIAHRFGYGTYHDIRGPLSIHHAKDAGGVPGKMCVIVSKIATGVVGVTEMYADAPPDGCDCGASGPDRAAWMRVSFHDSQVCPQYILYITFDT